MISICRVSPDKDPAAISHITLMHLECFRSAELDQTLFYKGWWWIAYDENKEPIAFAGMVPSQRWADTVYLCRSGVLRGHRGTGLQKRLIDARVRHAAKLGMNWAITDTRKNPASANSLIKAGFRMYEPAAPWSFKDACYWRKKLCTKPNQK